MKQILLVLAMAISFSAGAQTSGAQYMHIISLKLKNNTLSWQCVFPVTVQYAYDGINYTSIGHFEKQGSLYVWQEGKYRIVSNGHVSEPLQLGAQLASKPCTDIYGKLIDCSTKGTIIIQNGKKVYWQ